MASVHSETDSMIVLSILDGGWFDVTLIGYQDTCAYSFSKPVYFGGEAPIFINNYDTTGIQNVSISPNPTMERFTVQVEFGIAQNYSILVTNMNGQPVLGMSFSGVGELVSEDFNFPVFCNSWAICYSHYWRFRRTPRNHN